MADILEKIEEVLKKGKKGDDVIKKTKGAPSAKSWKAIRKLTECDWKEKHIRPVIAECIKELVECDDEATEQFMSEMCAAAKTIGENITSMYTVPGQESLSTRT
jgi:hypothetical protein